MKTRALLLALPLVALASCRDNSASVQVQEICFPPDDCEFGNECDRVLGGTAGLDVGTSALDRLLLVFQVANQTENTGDPDTGRSNTSDAHVDQAVIEYEGISLPRQVLAMGANRIPAGSTQLVFVEVIPDAMNATSTLSAFAPTADPRQMLALMRLRGYYDDGSRFETAEFPIGIEICTGCIGGCLPGQLSCPGNSEGQAPITCRDPE